MVDRNTTEAIYSDVESQLRAWIPQASSFSRSNIYGIRVYTSGSILAPHVDRDPLVSSAIINVDQSVIKPWPLEAYDHEGRAHNLTLLPGEMILYESHSVLHGESDNVSNVSAMYRNCLIHIRCNCNTIILGRPFALQGEYYANIFVHFKPEFHDVETDKTNDEL
jgi:prolyl 4-hydroxylase